MIDKQYFSGFSIFTSFSASHLDEIAEQANLLQFNPEEVIFADGEKATTLYGVLNGGVELIMIAEDETLKTDVIHEEYARSEIEKTKRDIVFDTVNEKEIFGWSSFTTSGAYTSKAVCVEPTRVIAMKASKLKAFLAKNPDVGYPFMQGLLEVLSQRLAKRTDKLIEGWSQAFKVNRV